MGAPKSLGLNRDASWIFSGSVVFVWGADDGFKQRDVSGVAGIQPNERHPTELNGT